MTLWSAKDVRKRCERAGFTITNEDLCLYIALLLNDSAIKPVESSEGDCVVVWAKGWGPE